MLINIETYGELNIKWRHYVRDMAKNGHVSNRQTECSIETNAKTVLARGVAYCSKDDNFNYKLGKRLSLLRALKCGKATRDIKVMVFKALREKGVKI